MSDPEAWTIGRLLEWTTGFLKEKSGSPRLDAENLLAAARDCERIELYTAFNEEPQEGVRAAFRQLVKRRADGEPVAYLVGHCEFYSLDFQVTRAVLIPRPETEFIVVALFDAIKESLASPVPLRIADVGTGSGILAICAAKNISRSDITAIDVSRAALDVAQLNAQQHGVVNQIEFVESDLFEEIPSSRFDFIISNPPYISAPEMTKLSVEVADYEPHLALFGGETGTEIIARLVSSAAACLETHGSLIVEISPMIEAAVRDLIACHPEFDEPNTIKDLAGHARVITAQRRSG